MGMFLKAMGVLAFIGWSTVAAAEPIKYVRFLGHDGPHWGVLSGEVIHELDNFPWRGGKRNGIQHSVSVVEFMPPASPTKVLAVGLNFASHSGDAGAAKPELFAKFPSSITGSGPVRLPQGARSIHYEGELVIVIGRRARNVDETGARRAIFGVTAGNDISERGWQSKDLQWVRAKASDGFAPIGPVLVSGLNWNDLVVTTRVNGEVRQRESTANLLHSPEKIVAWISRYITLEPGDVVFTGTPGQTRRINPGDVVEVEVEGVGVIRNSFVFPRDNRS